MIRLKLHAEKASVVRAGRVMGHLGFCVILVSLVLVLFAGVSGHARPPYKDADSLTFATVRLVWTIAGLALLVGAARRVEWPLAAWSGIAIQLGVVFLVLADRWYRPPAIAWVLVAAFAALTYRDWLVVPTPFADGVCTKCGYNLTGNTSGRCPECGAPTGTRSSAQDAQGLEKPDARAE